MPIDLLENEIPQQVNRKQPKQVATAQPIDLLENEMPGNYSPRESTTESYFRAPGRAIYDTFESGVKALKSIPGYREKSETEIPGAAKLLFKDKKYAGKQGLAGMAEAGERSINLPSEAARYINERLHLTENEPWKTYNKFMQSLRLPNDTQDMINRTFGEANKPGAALIRGTTRNAGNILGLAGILHHALPFKKAFKDLSPLERKLTAAQEGMTEAEYAESALKNEAIGEHNVGNVPSLEYKKNITSKKISSLREKLEDALGIKKLEVPNVGKYESELAEHKVGQEAHNEAKGAATQEINLSDVNKIQNRINEKQKKLETLTKDYMEGKPVTESEFNKAHEELNAAQNEYDMIKSKAESTIGTSKPESLQLKINNTTQKIDELNTKLKETPKNEPVKMKDYEENAKRSDTEHAKAQEDVKNAEQNIGSHLNENAAHSVRASREMKKEIQSIYDRWSNAYKDMMIKLKDSKFQLLNPDRIEAIKPAITRALQQFGEDSTGEFNQLMKKSPTSKDISASDFMKKQKDFRDARYDLLKRAKEEPSAVKRDELFKVYRESEPFEKIINDTLSEGLGEYKPLYDEIMRGYKEEVYPLRDNTVSSKIMEGKPMSTNMVGELAGDHPGQELLRTIAKGNEDIKKNIVGQQYKKKVDLSKPNEALSEYTNEMPNLNRLVEEKGKAQQIAKEATENREKAKASHKEAQDKQTAYEKEKKELEEKQAASHEEKRKLEEKKTLYGKVKTEIEKAHEEKTQAKTRFEQVKEAKEARENTHSAIQEINESLKIFEKHAENLRRTAGQVKEKPQQPKTSIKKAADEKKIQSQIKEMNDKISSIDQHIENLEQAAKHKELKLNEKIQIEKTLEEAKKAKASAKKRLIYTSGILTGAIFAPKVKDLGSKIYDIIVK